jgi:hypothetical protein
MRFKVQFHTILKPQTPSVPSVAIVVELPGKADADTPFAVNALPGTVARVTAERLFPKIWLKLAVI